MLITHQAHSEFLLEIGRFRLLTDPFDAHVGYEMKQMTVDCVTASHGHADHSFTDKAIGDKIIINTAGVHSAGPGVTITGIESDHDDKQGTLRGKNLIFVIEADGLRVVHLGDLGCALNQTQIRQIGRTDVLLVPVGGFFTIDAALAKKTAEALNARVVIPMHYKTQANHDWPIEPVEAFLAMMNANDAPHMPLLRVTAGDLSEQPPIAVLSDSCAPVSGV